ncbi:MAG: hypothetical protein ABEI99_04740 [Halobaculum sp.]
MTDSDSFGLRLPDRLARLDRLCRRHAVPASRLVHPNPTAVPLLAPASQRSAHSSIRS